MSTIKRIVTTLSAVAVMGFVMVTMIHMSKVNDNINKFREDTELTRLQVQSFVKISDPKSIQSYVSELNKILDNMHRLGKIIDKGEEVDLALARIEKQYHILGNKIDDMVTIKSHKETTTFTRDQTVQHIDEVYEEMEDIDVKLDRQYKAMLKKIGMIEQDIDDIKKLLKTFNKKKFFHTHKWDKQRLNHYG